MNEKLNEDDTKEVSWVIEGAQFYYLFSFAFSRIPLREKCTEKDKLLFGELLASKLPAISEDYYKPSETQYHEAEETEPCESRSVLYTRFPHISIKTKANYVKDFTISDQEYGRCKVNSHIAVFESGMGVIWICIEPDNKLSSDKLIDVVKIDCTSKNIIEIDETTTTIHQKFTKEVKKLIKTINAAISQMDPDIIMKFFPPKAIQPITNSVDDDSENSNQSDDNDPYTYIEWIYKKYDLFWQDDSDENKRGKEIYQEPCVSLIVKVNEETLALTDFVENGTHDNSEVSALQHAISSILHSCNFNNIDLSHSQEHTGVNFRNLYPDRRFKTFFHGNCLLVIHSQGTNTKEFANFCMGLFRTYCAVRGCWHMYNVINEQLDNTIKNLFNQFESIRDSKGNHYSFTHKLSEIIYSKSEFLMFLSIEDPLVRSVGLTNFHELYLSVNHAFRLDEFRDLVISKLKELDKLFQMVDAYSLRTPHKTTSNLTIISLLARFCLFCVLSYASLFKLPNYIKDENLPILFGSILVIFVFYYFVYIIEYIYHYISKKK